MQTSAVSCSDYDDDHDDDDDGGDAADDDDDSLNQLPIQHDQACRADSLK